MVFIIQTVQGQPAENGEIRIVELQGVAELMPAGAKTWVFTQTNQVLHAADRLRTGPNSRLTLLWCDQSVVPFGAMTEVEILPPDNADSNPGLHVLNGIASFFHREKPGRTRVLTHGATASIEGTEFVVEVNGTNEQEQSTFSVIDGKVRLSNEHGTLLLTNDQQGIAGPTKAPMPTAGFVANNLLQWCFYYPAVLDLLDLSFSTAEETDLKKSLDAYRAGDLLKALAEYPPARPSVSDVERVYHAALLLAVGQVQPTETELAALPADAADRLQRLANSLRTLIAAVKRQAPPARVPPTLATEFLAASYFEQSRATGEQSLKTALELARHATIISPQFSFAWSRVAELEFGFGRTENAAAALETSLKLSPQNAESAALRGFTLAAQNKITGALEWFNRALEIDSALGNAWLGRGLCRIRRGDAAGGRADLLIAAALEPQRSLLRSYLGKAFADGGDETRANHEIGLAIKLDPNDPTAWLYAALLKQQQNRINEAVEDLDNSQAKNDNRSLFRSRFLLDEDKAVRSANLASIYRDAGMTDVSVREASKAVTYDYANYSAHLFLSESYDALRDPTRFNLRYETVWFNELLLANLLSPVGGGRLAQHVSQQEYSSLLAADGFGIANSTTVRSDDQSVSEQVSQFATFGRTSYSLDLDYRHADGVRPNNDLDSIEWYSTIKQQVTAHDTAMAIIKYEDYHSGDNFQYYDPKQARPHFRFDESQEPIAVAAWHHEWSPSAHTLLLGGRLVNDQQFSDLGTPQLLLIQDANGKIIGHDFEPFDASYESKLEIYTIELNQIQQWNRFTLSAGGRYQSGSIDTRLTFKNPPGLVPFLFSHAMDTFNETENFERFTGYGYLTFQPFDRVWLTGGFAYDEITFPRNFRNPPITSGQDRRSQIAPKAAVVWEALPQLTLRGIYAQSLGGVSLDESYRLEPTQLAGFPQTFRTLIPESVVGSVAAPEYEIFGGALDFKFPTRTFIGLQIEQLNSQVRRTIGDYSLVKSLAPFVAGSTSENPDYCENSVTVTINQLIGDKFAAGASYKFDDVKLSDVLPGVPVPALNAANQQDHATLHETSAYLLFNHPSGFFTRLDATWYHQHNSGYNPALPGGDFIQENFYLGYRFLNQRCEIQFGILNLGDQNYHLNPLNVYAELPRERSYMARVKFIF